jgi:hypothetical protein
MTTYFFSDFQKEAVAVCSDRCATLDYLYPGFIAKLGEILEIEAKIIRGDYDDLSKDEIEGMIDSKIGDIYWFMAMIAQVKDLDIDFEIEQEKLDIDNNYSVMLTATSMLAVMATIYTAQNKPGGMICPATNDLESLFMQLVGFTRTLVLGRISEKDVLDKNINTFADRQKKG